MIQEEISELQILQFGKQKLQIFPVWKKTTSEMQIAPLIGLGLIGISGTLVPGTLVPTGT